MPRANSRPHCFKVNPSINVMSLKAAISENCLGELMVAVRGSNASFPTVSLAKVQIFSPPYDSGNESSAVRDTPRRMENLLRLAPSKMKFGIVSGDMITAHFTVSFRNAMSLTSTPVNVSIRILNLMFENRVRQQIWKFLHCVSQLTSILQLASHQFWMFPTFAR